LLKHETAGDPMSHLKWTRKTTGKIAQQLERLDIQVCPKTVSRLLYDMGYSLRVNHKTLESGNKNPPPRRVRNRQFHYIGQTREEFAARHSPIISVDTKKKELIGQFKNPGTSWEKEPRRVNDHDFRSDAQGMMIPYGIYDPEANRGFVVVGTQRETPAFAVDAILLWWNNCGTRMYPKTTELLILADCGGGNSSRARAWKYHLQKQLCDPFQITVTVCHYPPGASKWNPIEHRLFSQISKNWAGRPLDSYETATQYIRTTGTSSGLHVRARITHKNYEKGERIAAAEFDQLPLQPHKVLPAWNYTLTPAKM
jgi:DDE family transposase